MTAQDWKQKQALRNFALAVMGLPVSMNCKAETLRYALEEIDEVEHAELDVSCRLRFDRNLEWCCDSDNRTERRWAWRNLLRACGVDSRHV